MIETSTVGIGSTITYEWTVPRIRVVGEVNDKIDVATELYVSLSASTTFDHTYVSLSNTGIGTTMVTFPKTESTSKIIDVALDTSGISTSFTAWDSLTESQVLGWVSSSVKTTNKNDLTSQILESKDKVLNPLKYDIEDKTPVFYNNEE